MDINRILTFSSNDFFFQTCFLELQVYVICHAFWFVPTIDTVAVINGSTSPRVYKGLAPKLTSPNTTVSTNASSV